MKVTQISIGRFHHFHLARQFEKHNLLEHIWTGYPKFKLKDEQGIPAEKIKTFPWVQAPYMLRGKFGLDKWAWLNREWAHLAHETLDKHVAGTLKEAGIILALSGGGLHSGRAMQALGGKFICDRGSAHIATQNSLLTEEYKRWGYTYAGIDPRVIDKEQHEYEQADIITVPSEFARRSFLEQGIADAKIKVIPYGARLERFSKVAEPDAETFRVLWVGNIHFQKGFLDALQAFIDLKHPKKEFIVIGHLTKEIAELLPTFNLNQVVFKGTVPNIELPYWFSSSHVFVLSSIQDGFGIVLGEAMACGCPVIASDNTGARNILTDGIEGFIVPIRSPKNITEKMQHLADDHALQQKMSIAALQKVTSLGGWDSYGNNMAMEIKKWIKA